MKDIRKRRPCARALTAVSLTLGLAAAVPAGVAAHGGAGQYGQGRGMGPCMTMGQGMGPGMMGQGMGPGMMGQGMGPGMMGPGQYGRGMGPGMMGPGQYGRGMGPGMMGPGQYGPGTTERGPYGQGMGPGPGMRVVPDRDLSADDVRHFFDHWVQMHGLSGLQVGKVEQKGEDTIVAELTTKDGTLVQRYNVDRHTGAVQPAM